MTVRELAREIGFSPTSCVNVPSFTPDREDRRSTVDVSLQTAEAFVAEMDCEF